MAGSRFISSRGGHAPGHLRDAFAEAFDVSIDEQTEEPWYEHLTADDVVSYYDPSQQAQWDGKAPIEQGKWLIGQLWDCTDVMPSTLCEDIDLPAGSTYAQGVRKLRAEMD